MNRTSTIVTLVPPDGSIEFNEEDNHTVPSDSNKSGGLVTDFNRHELEARLNANKAEVSAIVSEMRREMAEWREHNSNQISQISTSINNISAKVDGKMDRIDGAINAINGKFDGVNGRFEGIQGQITGINTAISGIQSGMSTKLSIFGVIITAIVALFGFAGMKSEPQIPSSPPQPIIIQVPQASPPSVTKPTENYQEQKK
ncbi:hypothetical protein NL87_18315 [Salmonella enterica]|nr:hypothetical protein [Salmonella enterica subsp. enterica]EAW9008146.1 hypothetical protein [Salmonella enterica]EAY5638902.1 hypothetical protein [Salmonella enterica]EBP3786583.1 hypothetical protein [Salmonella enterica subsp. enterica]EBP3796187.1 hypothetical protein [Salmonella enterica subsp. enterica]